MTYKNIFHSLNHSCLIYSFIHPFIHPFIHSWFHPVLYSFINIPSLVISFQHSIGPSLNYSPVIRTFFCRWNWLYPTPSANTSRIPSSIVSLLVFLFFVWQVEALPLLAYRRAGTGARSNNYNKVWFSWLFTMDIVNIQYCKAVEWSVHISGLSTNELFLKIFGAFLTKVWWISSTYYDKCIVSLAPQ